MTKQRIRFLLPVLLAACATETTDNGLPEGSGRAIAFHAPQTRAAIEGTDGMNAFSVWGWYTPSADAQTPAQVFNAKEVTKAAGGNWTYDQLQYWIDGKTYDFYAVHPAGQSDVKVSPNGQIAITGFDASATGSDAIDLMTASRTGMSGDNPQAVAFTFRHLLARVQIKVQSKGDVTITKATLSGIDYKGDCQVDAANSTATWSKRTAATEQDSPFQASNVVLNAGNQYEASVFGDLLLLPLDAIPANAKLTLTCQYIPEQTTGKTYEVTLPTADVASWEPGRSYVYSLVVSTDVTLNVTVKDWEEKDYYIIW